MNGPLLIFDRTQDPCPTSAISAAMKNCYLICTLVKNFVEMRNSGLEILETMTVDRSLQIGFKCFIYFSVLQNVATTYPGKTHTRKTVQVRSMRIFSCYKSWSKTACCKFASKRRGNSSFLTNFLLLLKRVCNSFLYHILKHEHIPIDPTHLNGFRVCFARIYCCNILENWKTNKSNLWAPIHMVSQIPKAASK